ncbi:unnamed protein product [Ambrosiozyma monospora]|uniref:Unnamed protein product n=1 Tax=Ambrosiozyma monospora TaxID=43982 RepID=A0ACB5TY24_AMBMO|nr:unnamed protein product [Ambrosiozyma monospora]
MPMTGETKLRAQINVYPRTDNQKRDNNVAASYLILPSFTYSAFPVVADLHGGIPISSDSSSVAVTTDTTTTTPSVTPGPSSSVAPATASPAITVDVSYAGVIDNIHFSAINDDLHYVSEGEAFYHDGETLQNTTIVVANGKFDASASIGSELNPISFVATADNTDQTVYPATVFAEFTYQTVVTPFLPQNTAAAKRKLVKRAAGGDRTFTFSASTTLSTQISHSTLTSTSTEPSSTQSTSTSSTSTSPKNIPSPSYSAKYNDDGSIDVTIFVDSELGEYEYSVSDWF